MLFIDGYISYNYYKFKIEDETFSLTDYTYGGKIVFYLKNFSANISFNHNPKELFGMKSFTENPQVALIVPINTKE